MEPHFWRLEHLSDRQLLERLQRVLQTQRYALAEVVAHLGEVEERRLHLQAAHGSLFSYCVHRLGMSEDEACRRIEVARLARRFPALFAELASGGITLSVALLLKRVLSSENHRELIAAVRGASSQRAGEILAARFPRPDVPSRIRKLPEPQSAAWHPAHGQPTAGLAGVISSAPIPATIPAVDCVAAPAMPPAPVSQPSLTAPAPASVAAPLVPVSRAVQAMPAPTRAPGAVAADSPRPQQRIESLSAGRYRVQFTADAGLKRKLEQARDLLRHTQPNGDLGAIVSRALDSLLDDLLRRRFGVRKEEGAAKRALRATSAATPTHAGATAASTAAAAPTTPAAPAPTPANPAFAVAAPAAGTATAAAVTPRSSAVAAPAGGTATAVAANPASAAAAAVAATPSIPAAVALPQAAPLADSRAPSRIPRAARRAVLERDGLGCSWVDAEGQRCGSSAWLELDHRHPAGKGGSSEPENLRLLCRAHNRFAAEHAYGRAHIERTLLARRPPSARAPVAPVAR